MNKIKKSLVSLVACLLACCNVVGLAACGGLRADTTSVSESLLDDIDNLFGSSSSSASSEDSSNSASGNTDSSEDSSTDSSANSSEDSSSSENNTPVNEVTPYDGSTVTVTFYHTMGQALRGILDEYIVEFNKLYPNITIEATQVGDYDAARQQISTELAAGNSPSLAYCYPDHVALYQKSKAVISLDDYIQSDAIVTHADGTTETMGYTQAQLDDFIPAYFEEGKVYGDGKMYTLPIMKSTEVLYYNKTVFDQNGWTVPTTWGEMQNLCQQILAKYPNDIPFGYDSEANWFITMAEQLNSPYTSSKKGEYFLFNNDTNRQFVNILRTWYKNGFFTTQELYGAYTSGLFTQTDPTKQKVYMCIGSSAGATYQHPAMNSDGSYPFEVGIAMIPQWNTESPKVIQQGPSVCLFKKDNEQEVAAAWLFAKFLTTSVEYQALVSMNNGYCPVIQSVQQHPVYAEFLAKDKGPEGLKSMAVKMGLTQMDAYYVSPAFVGSSAARDMVGDLLQSCIFNNPSNGQTVAEFIQGQFDAAVASLKSEYDR